MTQEDERDVLDVLKFALFEETIGRWLRVIIQRLEKEQMATRRDQHKWSTLGRKTLS